MSTKGSTNKVEEDGQKNSDAEEVQATGLTGLLLRIIGYAPLHSEQDLAGKPKMKKKDVK